MTNNFGMNLASNSMWWWFKTQKWRRRSKWRDTWVELLLRM